MSGRFRFDEDCETSSGSFYFTSAWHLLTKKREPACLILLKENCAWSIQYQTGATNTFIHNPAKRRQTYQQRQQGKNDLPMKSATQSSKFNDVDFLTSPGRTIMKDEAGAKQTANTKRVALRGDIIVVELARLYFDNC